MDNGCHTVMSNGSSTCSFSADSGPTMSELNSAYKSSYPPKVYTFNPVVG